MHLNKELEKDRESLRLEVYRLNSVSDDSKQQGSELSEKLKLSGQENAAMRAELEELRKRLEMADLMLQQYSSQSDPSTANQQVQMLLEEKQHLEAHTHQVKLVAEERDSNISRVGELESQVAELKNAAELLSREQQARDHAAPQPSGPSESELALQEALNSLHTESEFSMRE
ncbi:hypothetical protein CRUP_003735 [Coryphaenoides rupestris]|nr:hypothetical protein CRUP_003735 [Coryphaenoides rupestris]